MDTSGIFALSDVDDRRHDNAVKAWETAANRQDELLVHNYVILETAALAARSLGRSVAVKLLHELRDLKVRWVDEALHQAAVESFQQRQGKFSLVDEISFLVMKEAGIHHALAFDEDFQREGFLPYPPQ